MGDKSYLEAELDDAMPIDEVPDTRRKSKERSRPWLIPLLAGTGIGVAIAFGGMRFASNRPAAPKTPQQSSQQETAPAMTVTFATATMTPVVQTLNTTGSVAARDLTPVLPQANGLQIKQVLVKVGDVVKEGQVMAVLDDSVLQEQIRQAKADVDSREADVTAKQADLASRQTTVTSSQASVASSQAVVQQRQADLAQAKAKQVDAQRNYDRTKQLADQGALSRQQLDTAQTTLATSIEAVRLAEANIRSAQANVRSAEASIGSAQAGVQTAQANVSSAQANVRSAQARVEQLRTQLSQTAVRAPVSGIVAEVIVRVGDVTGVPPQTQVSNVVGGSQKLFSIIREGQLELQALVPEVQLSQVRVGANVDITSDADNKLRLTGQVREIEPVVNQQRREATVKISLPSNNFLRPGMFARAGITTNTSIGVAIPQKAVLPQPDGSATVFTLSGEDRVSSKKVEVGEIIRGGKIEIKNGLKPGDRVIVDGAGYLKDGDRVKVVHNQPSNPKP